MTAASHPPSRRRASHSLEAVLRESIALLDESGETALTFRALATRLGGGVGSIYWYVANKDELLAKATDHVLAEVLTATEGFADADDPIDDLRAIAVTFFDTIVDRPWLAAYFMRDTGAEPNGLLLYERLGQQILRLGLPPRQAFHAVSAVLGFVIGIAADLSHQPPSEIADDPDAQADHMAATTEQWRALDRESHPFIHYVLDEFATHDDREQFRAGLELLLSGLRLQAAEA